MPFIPSIKKLKSKQTYVPTKRIHSVLVFSFRDWHRRSVVHISDLRDSKENSPRFHATKYNLTLLRLYIFTNCTATKPGFFKQKFQNLNQKNLKKFKTQGQIYSKKSNFFSSKLINLPKNSVSRDIK